MNHFFFLLFWKKKKKKRKKVLPSDDNIHLQANHLDYTLLHVLVTKAPFFTYLLIDVVGGQEERGQKIVSCVGMGVPHDNACDHNNTSHWPLTSHANDNNICAITLRRAVRLAGFSAQPCRPCLTRIDSTSFYLVLHNVVSKSPPFLALLTRHQIDLPCCVVRYWTPIRVWWY